MRSELYTLEPAEIYEDELKTFVRWLEPALLLVVAPVAIFAERAAVLNAQLGLVLLLVPYLLRKAIYGYFLIATPATLPLAALLFVALPLSIWVTPAAGRFVWPELLRILWSIAVLLGVVHWVFRAGSIADSAGSKRNFAMTERLDEQGRLPSTLTELTTLYMVGGAVITVSSLLILHSADKLTLLTTWAEQLPRVYSYWFYGFYNNEIGGIVLLFLPLTTTLLLGVNTIGQQNRYDWLWRGGLKILLLLLLLLFSAALLLAQSRAAWLGATVGCILSLTLLGRRGWIPLLFLTAMVVITLMALGPTQVFDKLTVGSNVKTANGIVTGILTDRNLAARFLIWQRALHGIADAPLTGMGLAAFRQVAREPYAPLAGYHIDPDIHHAHNLFLQIGVDLGLLGLFAFCLLLLIAIVALVRCYRQAPKGSPMRTWTVGLAGSLLAYLFYSMFDTITLGAQRSIAFWFLLGLCLAAGELCTGTPKPKSQSLQFQQPRAIAWDEMQLPVHFLPLADGFMPDKTGHPREYQEWIFSPEKAARNQNGSFRQP